MPQYSNELVNTSYSILYFLLQVLLTSVLVPYSLDKAKKSSVFLEDLKLPTQFVKEIKNEN